MSRTFAHRNVKTLPEWQEYWENRSIAGWDQWRSEWESHFCAPPNSGFVRKTLNRRERFAAKRAILAGRWDDLALTFNGRNDVRWWLY